MAVIPDWHADARCRDYPEVSWFPDRYGGDWETPKRICARCPVLAECRSWAMRQGRSLQGIWGGLSEQQRRNIRKSDFKSSDSEPLKL
jgi:WhiB family redox-sensing transcriptional regulator